MFRVTVHRIGSRPADKPGSVVGGHLSGTAVARRLKRPTRGSDGTGHPVWRQGWALPPRRPCLALLPVGVAWPPGSPRTPVVSYTTFSPLPALVMDRYRSPPTAGGLFLWPYPSGCPAWVLPSTVPCGARTFLTPRMARSATAWPTWSNFILTYSPTHVKQKRGFAAACSHCKTPPGLSYPTGRDQGVGVRGM